MIQIEVDSIMDFVFIQSSTTSVPKFGRYGDSNPRPERFESDLRDFRSASPEVGL
jgi:hypothetical protein